MSDILGKNQQTTPVGVPVTYYETCRRIEYLASLGMPQVTPYTEPAKPLVATLPEPRELLLGEGTPLSSPSPVLLPVEPRRTVTPSITSTLRGTCRKKPELERFDMDAAYAAFIQRLEQKLDEEEARNSKEIGSASPLQ
ncbi:hypothetical protein C4B63_39g347 [Trypanosoma cruzi]|uniref:Uncharacterized protein n=1 Tax=Trypanosoma cruzi TaxID=5693 RepID=A0A2V2V703_TRYCR|nr:hypothetical protein C4B63_39g347 [Trypanosoma cruzi]